MDLYKEIAEKFDLVADGYWVRGLSFEQARERATQALADKSAHEPQRVITQRR
ncbi:hypothetical protein [Parafrankia sp. BMG5.11]|uniref:hypothetical protein n=1 Tax=Parafrankia sp. BMG5.11 TaxID=222540 RepID=UPI0014054299|nr:hypothetical protein [Parafrankia sp. BMG5.11]